MIEIAPHARPPLATLLAVALPLLFVAGALLRGVPTAARRRVYVSAVAAGLLLAAASAALWSRRHAGMGTETARGWPRAVYARWEPFEGGASRAGVLWRGVAESALAYASASALLLAVAAPRRRPAP